MGAKWTEDRVEKLTRLWKEGLSASHIARQFGDITRNAVIGKVHRLGIAGRDRVLKPGQGGRPRVWARKNPEPLPAPEPCPGALNIPMVRVRRKRKADSPRYYKVAEMVLTDSTCKWPVSGEGADTRFCGHASEPGQSYCAYHQAKSANIVQRKPKARQDHFDFSCWLSRKQRSNQD